MEEGLEQAPDLAHLHSLEVPALGCPLTYESQHEFLG